MKKDREKDVFTMRKACIISCIALILCTAVLLTACGTALSEVFLQMRGPSLLFGL